MGFFRDFFGSADDDDESELLDGDEDEDEDEAPRFDAVAVLEAGGVSAAERRHVDKARGLLESLPKDTPAAVERKIVEAALRAFDVPLEDILVAARREIEAFEGFIEAADEHEEEVRRRGHARIVELEAEIARIRGNLDRAQEEQRILAGAASEAIEEVRPVLTFFGDAARASERPGPAKTTDAEASPSVVVDMGADEPRT